MNPGTRLGPYEILSAIGAGGMGEVYKARDTRLDRTVAIKVLARSITGRPEVLQRFEREARTVSTLNHPNICTLHDVGTENGQPYLVMEYVEGETLADRIARGPLPMPDVWRIAIQIGDALDQAHRQGIVHRDLKPGNVMLAGGKGSTNVKLLDFGLAKVSEAQAAGTLTSLPTVVQSLTTEGSVVGTFQYMPPEQLEGNEADQRSDIFAFGCVLYEMVTGRKAFEGKSQATLISAIMTAEPPSIGAAQPMAPPALDRVIRKCLAKNPDDRWQTARDLAGELRWISESGSQVAAAPAIAARRRWRVQTAWIVCAVLTTALAAVLAIHLQEGPPEAHITRFTVSAPDKYGFGLYDVGVLSPDGTKLAFLATTGETDSLFVRSFDLLAPKPLTGTDQAAIPFWSPDGRYVAFSQSGKLKKIDLAGGPPVPLCDVQSWVAGTWNAEGTILFHVGGGRPLMRVAAAGGTATPLTKLDTARGETGHMWPHFLPDGRHFLFTVTSGSTEVRGVYAGALDSPDKVRILNEEANAQYSPPGFLLYPRGDVLTAQPFDAARRRVTGDAFPVADQLFSLGGVYGSAYSTAAGSLVYRTGDSASAMVLAWYNRKGTREGQVGEPGDYTNPALSPDGRTLAVGKRDPVTRNRTIWLFDLVRGTSSRLTFDPSDNLNPTWSPDGRQIAFSSKRKGEREIFLKSSSGTGQEETLLRSDLQSNVEDWTRDGKYLIYNQQSPGKIEILALPLTGDRKPIVAIGGPGQPQEGQVSPDGKWMAYRSTESGRPEVYVQNFPPAGGKWQISTGGGADPQWGRNGKELFYVEGTKMIGVEVKADGARFDAGVPKALFETRLAVVGRNRYVVSPDSQRFLVVTPNETASGSPLFVVQNWYAGVKR